MFDPLDLYDGTDTQNEIETSTETYTFINDKAMTPNEVLSEDEEIDNDDAAPLFILDLPPVSYASPETILATLSLLSPDTQVNFKSSAGLTAEEICNSKHITNDLQEAIVDWYANITQNKKLDNISKICNMIPQLVNSSDTERSNLLNYYTSILKKYENPKTVSSISGTIVKEVSLRIAECCGRSAIPSMSRDFKFENMTSIVSLFEPSLTADNLGWKTWGASLILSEVLVENFTNIASFKKKENGEPLKVLELGAGTGLVGISWACKWKELNGTDKNDIEMYITDLPEIVDNLKKNTTANGIDSFVTADVLDWTKADDFVQKYSVEDQSFDIILVADPIYSPNHPEWVVNMISKFLRADGTCYLEIPIRPKYAVERQVLIDLLDKNNFSIGNERYDQGIDDWGSVKYLYREIRRK
ncbi:S-adenosylmethionine-dependent methyltransferase [Maudiozyma humilis]|uniref:S-adenosylmethionine-dependent methyltransferase n=1 Tax=Maudiozyma humilis TaxID=51915 RepID=A0AAV5RTP6_MAUHU|nr:S-adenosylmethionine-dependent methyltransferase [Kazachstania humilis]